MVFVLLMLVVIVVLVGGCSARDCGDRSVRGTCRVRVGRVVCDRGTCVCAVVVFLIMLLVFVVLVIVLLSCFWSWYITTCNLTRGRAPQ